jgi:hypothetical protein
MVAGGGAPKAINSVDWRIVRLRGGPWPVKAEDVEFFVIFFGAPGPGAAPADYGSGARQHRNHRGGTGKPACLMTVRRMRCPASLTVCR